MTNDFTSNAGLHYEVHGSGDPVLCLHGLGASTYSWREFRVPIARDHKLILLDFKGFGASPKPKDRHYAITEHAELAYQFIRELDLRRLTLVGNSFGGAVSLLVTIKLLEERPRRLEKLILIDSGGYNQKLPLHLKLLRAPVLGWLVIHILPTKVSALFVLRNSYYDDDKITQTQIETYARPIADRGGRHALLETAKQIIPANIEELIPKYRLIDVPTLIIWGKQDEVIPIDIGQQLHTDIRTSRLITIEHSGHVPQEETPKEVIPLMLDFLQQLAGDWRADNRDR